MTTLKEQLRNDLTEAMRARDEIRTATLRMALTAVTNEEVSGKEARELSDADVLAVLGREAKKRRESATAYDDAQRPELADRSALSGVELAAIISAAVAQAKADGAEGPRAMGAVMKLVTPQVTGRADGAQVAAEVRRLLA